MDYFEHRRELCCSECGNSIAFDTEYYVVAGSVFCMRCESEAEQRILDEVREQYIFTR